MENNGSKVVTFEDLVKYTEEVLFPGFEEMMDEKIGDFRVEVNERFNSIDERFNSIDERFGSIEQQLVNIQAEISDIKSEISAIKGRLNQIEIRLDRLEKMVEGDSKMYISEIAELKKANQDITKRLTLLESKSA